MLLAGDMFMFEMQLRKPGLTFDACGPITKKQNKNIKFQFRHRLLVITTSEFNKINKTKFWCKMKQGAKSFACKCQVDNALDRADKNREKN